MVYRTRTYIAGDWTGDNDAVEQLRKWNDSNNWSLSYTDAHELNQARDGSLNCNIKKSLATRIDASKTFVLVVGKNTKTVRSGGCHYCESYNSLTGSCVRNYYVDLRSYVEYECQKAVKDNLKIVVLYKAATVDKSKCPDAVRNMGTHAAMYSYKDSCYYWDYQNVKSALV